jgi:hypothetical protein
VNDLTATTPERAHSATPADASAQQATVDEDESAPNLREILRSRKRPRDRIREATRKPEPAQSQALVVADAPKQDLYATRFVAQTGQVVDRDDRQM